MKLKFIDPEQVMSAIVALIILGVGVFAVMITLSSIPVTTPSNNTSFGGTAHTHTYTSALQNTTYKAILNGSRASNQVFNIIGVVLIIAAIMSIIGLVYSYIKPRM
jgi:tellurite resistance protein TehA-like permease